MAEAPKISVDIEATLDKLDAALASGLTRIEASTQAMAKASAVPLFGDVGVITGKLDAGLLAAEAKVAAAANAMAKASSVPLFNEVANVGGMRDVTIPVETEVKLDGLDQGLRAVNAKIQPAPVIPVVTEVKLGGLDRGLAQAEAKVEESGKRMGGSLAGGLAGNIEAKLLRTFAGIKALEGAFKLVTGVSEAFRGNLDKANEALRSFPVLGRLAGSFADMVVSITGINEGLDELPGKIAAARRESERLAEQIKGRDEGITRLADIEAASKSRLSVESNREGFSRDFARLGADEQAAIQHARELAEKTGASANEAAEAIRKEYAQKRLAFVVANQRQEAAALAQVQAENHATALEAEGRFLDARIARIEADYNERIRLANAEGRGGQAAELETQKQLKIVEVRVEADTGSLAALDLFFGELDRKVAEHERELQAVEAENRAVALELEGRDLDARQARIKADYDKRIAVAREAGDAEVIVALETQRRLKIAETERDPGRRLDLALEKFFEFEGKIESAERRVKDIGKTGGSQVDVARQVDVGATAGTQGGAEGTAFEQRLAKLNEYHRKRIEIARSKGDEEAVARIESERKGAIADERTSGTATSERRLAKLNESWDKRIALARKKGNEEAAVRMEAQRAVEIADRQKGETNRRIDQALADALNPAHWDAAERKADVLARRVDRDLAKMFAFEAEIDKQSRGVEPDLAGRRDEGQPPPKAERNPQIDDTNKILAEIAKNTKPPPMREPAFA